VHKIQKCFQVGAKKNIEAKTKSAKPINSKVPEEIEALDRQQERSHYLLKFGKVLRDQLLHLTRPKDHMIEVWMKQPGIDQGGLGQKRYLLRLPCRRRINMDNS